jgi:hypothetical protein
MRALPKLFDKLPQFVRVRLDDLPGFFQGR